MNMKNSLFCFAIILLFLSCNKNDTNNSSCNYDACGHVAPASEIASVQSYLTANNIVATQHCSGLFYAIDQPGTGNAPTVCNTVVINYEGRLTNGTVFDKTTNAPATFALSLLITGFKNGIPLIKTGGKIRLYIPPSLGYGSNPPPNSVPPNSVLIFTVELLGFQ